ncbi:hypothetical protein [Flavobacterium sp. N1736]|uniref:hypothetical protein n=1 Tax=Flavobacterium sp. N1736 TaxID=2986823 RepID=UPI0022252077|nr:hypothetical protein [Flavobacterium sp. N1736]
MVFFCCELDETAVTGIGETSDLIIGNIGEIELASGTAPAPYKGQFDELQMFNYPLNATQVLELFNQDFLSTGNSMKTKAILRYILIL